MILKLLQTAAKAENNNFSTLSSNHIDVSLLKNFAVIDDPTADKDHQYRLAAEASPE